MNIKINITEEKGQITNLSVHGLPEDMTDYEFQGCVEYAALHPEEPLHHVAKKFAHITLIDMCWPRNSKYRVYVDGNPTYPVGA